jgi:hypothetical protein
MRGVCPQRSSLPSRLRICIELAKLDKKIILTIEMTEKVIKLVCFLEYPHSIGLNVEQLVMFEHVWVGLVERKPKI